MQAAGTGAVDLATSDGQYPSVAVQRVGSLLVPFPCSGKVPQVERVLWGSLKQTQASVP